MIRLAMSTKIIKTVATMTDDDVCTNMETRPAPVELLVAVLQPGL